MPRQQLHPWPRNHGNAPVLDCSCPCNFSRCGFASRFCFLPFFWSPPSPGVFDPPLEPREDSFSRPHGGWAAVVRFFHLPGGLGERLQRGRARKEVGLAALVSFLCRRFCDVFFCEHVKRLLRVHIYVRKWRPFPECIQYRYHLQAEIVALHCLLIFSPWLFSIVLPCESPP